MVPQAKAGEESLQAVRPQRKEASKRQARKSGFLTTPNQILGDDSMVSKNC